MLHSKQKENIENCWSNPFYFRGCCLENTGIENKHFEKHRTCLLLFHHLLVHLLLVFRWKGTLTSTRFDAFFSSFLFTCLPLFLSSFYSFTRFSSSLTHLVYVPISDFWKDIVFFMLCCFGSSFSFFFFFLALRTLKTPNYTSLFSFSSPLFCYFTTRKKNPWIREVTFE